MRPTYPLLVLAGVLLLGGCNHPSGTATSAGGPSPIAAGAPVAPQRLLHVYVDSALLFENAGSNHSLAEAVALTLRNELRLRGYDVRAAEAVGAGAPVPSAPGAAMVQLGALAHSIAAGSPPPASTRHATYLHANSPRLLLFVALDLGAARNSHQPAELRLGAFLANPATGEILWAERVSGRVASNNQGVRRLAGKLLHNLTLVPPS